MLKGASQLHKRIFDRWVDQDGVTITVRQPAPRSTTTTDVQKVMGFSGEENQYGATQDISVIWTTDYTSLTDVDSREILDALGALALTNNDLDVVIRCKLADVLLTGASKHSRTILETAFDVLFEGDRYEVQGTVRTGLPPYGPYILWAGLLWVGQDTATQAS